MRMSLFLCKTFDPSNHHHDSFNAGAFCLHFSYLCLGLFAPACSLLSKAGNIDVRSAAGLCLLLCCIGIMRESLVMPVGWAPCRADAAVNIVDWPCCTGSDAGQAADTGAVSCLCRCIESVCIG